MITISKRVKLTVTIIKNNLAVFQLTWKARCLRSPSSYISSKTKYIKIFLLRKQKNFL